MPMKNKEFLAALNNTSALRTATPSDRDSALEAILLADETSQTAFEKAAVDHKTFWGTIDTPNLAALVARPKLMGGDYLELNPKTPDTFKSMRQAAAEQRVKFALASTTPDVLIGLLTSDYSDNGTILRTYLESRQNDLNLNLSGKTGWNTANEDILTKEAVLRIRKEAANQLLIQLMAKPGLTDPKLFDDLVKAKDNLANFKAAADKIITAAGGLPPLPPGKTVDDVLQGLALDSIDVVVEAAKQRHKDLLDAPAIVEFERQLQKFRSSVTDAQLLGMQDTLKKDEKLLIEGLAGHANLKEDPQNPYKSRIANLPEDKKKALATSHKQPLCEQYLKARILTINKGVGDAQLVAALNDTTSANLTGHLKTFINIADDNGIIEKAVTDANLAEFKVALTKNAIKAIGAGGTPADLTSLKELETAAKDLESFRKELAKKVPGVASFDFVKEKDLPELRKALGEQLGNYARAKRELDFAAEVKKTRLGEVAHQKLIAVFNDLPNEKQEEIVKTLPDGSNVVDTQKLEVLIQAKTETELKFHLGSKNVKGEVLGGLVDLVAENARAAAFKQIHNPTIAKVMAGFTPRIALTPVMIDTINTALRTNPILPLDISTKANFKTVVDAISTACFARANDPQEAAFYQAFGFTDHNANAFTTDPNAHPIAVAAQDEHTRNKAALEYYAKATTGARAKRFLDAFLRVAPAGMVDTSKKLETAGEAFVESKNVQDFLDKLIPETAANADPVKRNQKDALSREFTSDVYSDIEILGIKSDLAGDEDAQKRGRSSIDRKLEQVQETKSTIEKHKGYLKSLNAELAALPALFSGANDVKAKNKAHEVKEKYQDLSRQSRLIVEHLHTTKHDLQKYLAAIPSPATAKSEKQRKALDAEIKAIDQQLEFYKGLQKQINGEDGAIANIDKVMKGKATVQVEKATVTYSVIPIGQEKTAILQSKSSANVGTTSVTTNVDESSPNYKVHEIPEKGNVFSADLVHKKDNPARGQPGQPDEIEDPNGKARVTVNYHPEGKPSTTGSKPISVSLPIVAKDKNYRAEQCMEAAKQLLKDWDGKSPIKLRGVHGKETELAYLWTAVCVLGEHHPKFSMDKIEFRGSCAWRPDQGKDKQLGGIRGKSFAKDSLYNTVFKGSARGLVEEIENEFKAMVNPKKRDQVDKGVVSATSLFRDKMSTGRQGIADQAERNIKARGEMEATITPVPGGNNNP
ncbi:interaptin [Legionella sp. 227]|uniref:interaptin n=1 Tax=Legionella sp. 227 TaxID=3367288 RepID=UPI00370DD9D4